MPRELIKFCCFGNPNRDFVTPEKHPAAKMQSDSHFLHPSTKKDILSFPPSTPDRAECVEISRRQKQNTCERKTPLTFFLAEQRHAGPKELYFEIVSDLWLTGLVTPWVPDYRFPNAWFSVNALTRDSPTRDSPTRDFPNRDSPTRDSPTRDSPTRDSPTRDSLTCESLNWESLTFDSLTLPDSWLPDLWLSDSQFPDLTTDWHVTPYFYSLTSDSQTMLTIWPSYFLFPFHYRSWQTLFLLFMTPSHGNIEQQMKPNPHFCNAREKKVTKSQKFQRFCC